MRNKNASSHPESGGKSGWGERKSTEFSKARICWLSSPTTTTPSLGCQTCLARKERGLRVQGLYNPSLKLSPPPPRGPGDAGTQSEEPGAAVRQPSLTPAPTIPELCPGMVAYGESLVFRHLLKPLALSALAQALVTFLTSVSPPLPSDIGTQGLEKQSCSSHSDSFFSGLRRAVRCEGTESREGQGNRHLCQHVGDGERTAVSVHPEPSFPAHLRD